MFIRILTKVGTIDQKHGVIVTKEKMAGYFSCPSLFVDLEQLQQMQGDDRAMRAKAYIQSKITKENKMFDSEVSKDLK